MILFCWDLELEFCFIVLSFYMETTDRLFCFTCNGLHLYPLLCFVSDIQADRGEIRGEVFRK